MSSNWREFLLRRALGRMHVNEDILRHLSTFQRLGATLETAPPRELLPVGARTMLRALRTRGASDIRPDWLWPYWLERQLDPHDAAFTPRGHLPAMQNVTNRNWTLVGNMHSAWEGVVDAAGLVSPIPDEWSLDWWVRVGERWHFPSRAPEVRQGLRDARPVVVTHLPVPGGEIRQEVYGVETVPEQVAMEIENATDEVVEVAFAVRPYNPEGLAVVQSLVLTAEFVEVNARGLVVLPGRPERHHLSTFHEGDCATALERGEMNGSPRVEDPAGLAQGTFVYSLAPRERIRASTPLEGRTIERRWRLPWRRRMQHTAPATSNLPGADDALRDWDIRMDRGMRVEVPHTRLQEAIDSNRAYLLLLHDPGSITAGPLTYHRFWFRDAAYQVAALDRWGFHDEAADILRSYPARQRRDGYFYSQWREWDANGAAIWTAAEHDRLTGDHGLMAELAPSLGAGTRWIARTCADDRGKDAAASGLMPAGISAEHLGPHDYYYWDDLWAWRGLLDGATIASRHGDDTTFRQAEVAATRLEASLRRSWQDAAMRLGAPVVPAGPTRGYDAGMIGSLAACYPLGLLGPDDPRVKATAEVVRERFCIGEAFYQGISHTGLGTYLTLQLAFVELEAGDERAWARFAWLLDAATATYTWPEAIHPQLRGGCMGDGHHGWVVADVLNFARMLLVRETGRGLALLTLMPPGWWGERVSVRDAPTHFGRITYELDWDGDTPVLSWECERGGVPLTAPGVDASWRTVDRVGVARLSPQAGDLSA